MAVGIDEYKKMKRKSMDRTFTELFALKAEKKILDDKIKELEAIYKPDLVGMKDDMFFELDNGLKFSIRKSIRKGALDVAAIEEATDIDCDDYRKKSSTIYTLRLDK